MAEEVVEHVRLDEIVEFVLVADPARYRKPAVRQMIEEHVVGNEPGNRHELPPGRRTENGIGVLEARDAVGAIEPGKTITERGTGVAGDKTHLARMEAAPAIVHLRGIGIPVLADGIVGSGTFVFSPKAACACLRTRLLHDADNTTSCARLSCVYGIPIG